MIGSVEHILVVREDATTLVNVLDVLDGFGDGLLTRLVPDRTNA